METGFIAVERSGDSLLCAENSGCARLECTFGSAATRPPASAPLGEMMAAQAMEDEAGRVGFKGGTSGPGLYHRYNAVLKRMTGNKYRAQMTLASWRRRSAG